MHQIIININTNDNMVIENNVNNRHDTLVAYRFLLKCCLVIVLGTYLGKIITFTFCHCVCNKDKWVIFGGQVDNYDYHYFGWNFEFMNEYLTEVGFLKINKVNSFGLFEDTSDYKPYGFPISLNVIAIK